MTKFFSIDQLRDITNDAIKRAKNEKTHKEEREKHLQQLALEQQQNRARGYLAELPGLAYKAALEGKNSCIIFRLKDEDFADGRRYNHNREVVIAELGGAALICANACIEMGYTVRITYDWDGGGMDSWHEFVVVW
jgi:hypothetical protein